MAVECPSACYSGSVYGMIAQHLDADGKSFHDEFQAWRTGHRDGVFLTLKTRTRANLHGEASPHPPSCSFARLFSRNAGRRGCKRRGNCPSFSPRRPASRPHRSGELLLRTWSVKSCWRLASCFVLAEPSMARTAISGSSVFRCKTREIRPSGRRLCRVARRWSAPPPPTRGSGPGSAGSTTCPTTSRRSTAS